MGFALASKGAPLAGLLKKFFLAAPAASALGPRSVAGACRLFNTGGPPHRRDESGFSYPQAFSLDPSVERGCFDVSYEDDDIIELKVALTGIPKEQVKLSAYLDALLVKWEGVKRSDGDEDPPSFSCRINLSPVAFKLDQTKAEMKDGLLTVTMPKNKDAVVWECTDIKIE